MPRKIGNLEILKRIGEAVHGPYWQKSLAEDLGVNRRTINRWIQGASPVSEVMPDGTPIGVALMKVVERHEKALNSAKVMLIRFISTR